MVGSCSTRPPPALRDRPRWPTTHTIRRGAGPLPRAGRRRRGARRRPALATLRRTTARSRRPSRMSYAPLHRDLVGEFVGEFALVLQLVLLGPAVEAAVVANGVGWHAAVAAVTGVELLPFERDGSKVLR